MNGRIRVLQSMLIIFLWSVCQVNGNDWPTWRHDAGRSGYTTEILAPSLQLQWSHRMADVPRPAWPRSNRMTFDRACQTIIAEGLVFFGGSVDGTIHALDAATGDPRWQFPTRGPIRFAPAYSKGRIFAVSDDGYLYCLKALDGTLLWKKRGGPSDEMVLGNARMVSRWPARGGAVILDGVVYFAAGIWPTDGVSLYALDPLNGETLWVNDTAGSIYMGQPHGGASANSGVAAQGYLAAASDQIFMATGRAVPAAFDRGTGKFQYLALQANSHRGGAEVMLSDRFFINGGYAFEQRTGARKATLGAGPVVATPEGVVGLIGGKMTGLKWTDKESVDRKGKAQQVRALEKTFSVAHKEAGISAVVAGDKMIIGSKNAVSVTKLGQASELWRAEVLGTVYGLAVAGQRLFVSTDQGMIYCFGKDSGAPRHHGQDRKPQSRVADSVFARAAEEIVRRSKVTEGYCLDLGCGDGQLAIELAQRTKLFIYGIESDPSKVAAARERLIAAGLYGSRVMVLEGELADTNLPDYFANLIVSTASHTESLPSEVLVEAQRLMRPWGGMLITGKPGAMMEERRGPLAGAGQWTHQYADPANTVNSGDELVSGSLTMLWYSDLEQPMTQRHGRAPAPLFNKGVLYSEGVDSLIAVDAYNGHQLWNYPLPGVLKAYDGDHLMGTSGTGSNYCVTDDSVYVRMADHCLRIDARTGKLISKFEAPRAKGAKNVTWGYLAVKDGLLFGSLSDPEHVVTYRFRAGGSMKGQLTESKTFFALNAVTGEQIWSYEAQHSLRHNSISIGNHAVVLIDRPAATFDRTRSGKPKGDNHPTGELVALHTSNGDVIWRNQEDIYGTVTAISEKRNAVLMSYQPTRFRLASEVGGRLSVFDLSDGKRKWEAKSDYVSRPLINGDTIYAQGGAWDLMTGEARPFNFKRSYGCGVLAGSRDMMVFRSATLGYFDLTKNSKTENYGGIRPGCWINAIPAGGLVFAPDASAGCKCSYLNQSWIALQPVKNRRASGQK